MNENKIDYKDTKLLISQDPKEAELYSPSYYHTEFEPEAQINLGYNKQNPSDPLEKSLEKDYEEIPVQEETSGVQVKELLSSSSDEIALSPSLAAEEEMELEKEEKKKLNKFLKSTIKGFFGSYCEVSMVACALRERWLLLLSILICSKAALEVKNMEILVTRLFLVSYCCLVYQMIENMLQYRFLRITTNFRNEKAECVFDFADKAIILFFISILNLQYYKLINEWFMVFPPLFFLLEILMYRRHCLTSQSQDDMKIVGRIFFVLQSLIALKMTNIYDFHWKTTFLSLWIYLSIYSLYAIFAGLLLVAVCLTSILNLDGRTLCFLRTRILGYVWHIGCYMMNIAGLIILFGLFYKIDDSNDDETLQLGLEITNNLSSFLVVFSALLFPLLKKANFNLFQDLGSALQNQVARVIPRKRYAIIKTEEQKREAFFLMVSSTYYSQLREISQEKFKEMMTQKNDIENPPENKEEGSLCYICESHVSNAILVECGHGGVCCECALKLVEQKNECMECRKPATAIYKIKDDSTYKLEAIVQAHQLVEIIEI